MHLIHSIPHCEEIAIWYDEYLVPGENFNDSIKRMIHSCDFFSLVITPNLITEKNYVQEVEYPLALEKGKVVIPVEMSTTDESILSMQFINMPPIIKGDEGEICKKVDEIVNNTVNSSSYDNPEHFFLIGLAFLNGIDVEVDYKKAFSLILKAANAGLIEAVEEVVSIYINGRGINRNVRQAIDWQKKIVEHYSSLDDVDRLCIEMHKLINLYKAVDDIQNGERIAKELVKLCECNNQRNPSMNSMKLLGNAYYIYSKAIPFYSWDDDADTIRECLEEEETWIRKSHIIFDKLYEQYKTFETKEWLAESCIRLGDFLLANFEFLYEREAVLLIKKAISIREEILREKNTEQNMYKLIDAYNVFDSFAEKHLGREDAYSIIHREQLLLDLIISQTNRIEARCRLTDCMYKFASLENDEDRQNTAYNNVVKMCEDIITVTESTSVKKTLVHCYNQLCKLGLKKGEFDSAIMYLEKAISIRESLFESYNGDVFSHRALLELYGIQRALKKMESIRRQQKKNEEIEKLSVRRGKIKTLIEEHEKIYSM